MDNLYYIIHIGNNERLLDIKSSKFSITLTKYDIPEFIRKYCHLFWPTYSDNIIEANLFKRGVFFNTHISEWWIALYRKCDHM